MNRPYGPGTAIGISLVGQCNNELPQFVGYGTGTTSINLSLGQPRLGFGSVTVTAWINPVDWPYSGSSGSIFSVSQSICVDAFSFDYGYGEPSLVCDSYYYDPTTLSIANNTWSFVAAVVDGTNAIIYVNDQYASGAMGYNRFCEPTISSPPP